jgi:hypothetical protein
MMPCDKLHTVLPRQVEDRMEATDKEGICSMALSSDNHLLMAGGYHGSTELWNLTSKSKIKTQR